MPIDNVMAGTDAGLWQGVAAANQIRQSQQYARQLDQQATEQEFNRRVETAKMQLALTTDPGLRPVKDGTYQGTTAQPAGLPTDPVGAAMSASSGGGLPAVAPVATPAPTAVPVDRGRTVDWDGRTYAALSVPERMQQAQVASEAGAENAAHAEDIRNRMLGTPVDLSSIGGKGNVYMQGRDLVDALQRIGTEQHYAARVAPTRRAEPPSVCPAINRAEGHGDLYDPRRGAARWKGRGTDERAGSGRAADDESTTSAEDRRSEPYPWDTASGTTSPAKSPEGANDRLTVAQREGLPSSTSTSTSTSSTTSLKKDLDIDCSASGKNGRTPSASLPPSTPKQYPGLKKLLTSYMQGQVPSDRQVVAVMLAADGQTEAEVKQALQVLYHERGHRPGTESGPQSFAWFPVVIKSYFDEQQRLENAAHPAPDEIWDTDGTRLPASGVRS